MLSLKKTKEDLLMSMKSRQVLLQTLSRGAAEGLVDAFTQLVRHLFEITTEAMLRLTLILKQLEWVHLTSELKALR
jgi:hypothetical protein